MSASPNQYPIRVIFDVPELFERVLLHMPIKDLILNAPRVCKDWKQMIDTSPSLQRGLFLRPVQASPQGEGTATTTRVANPFRGHTLDGLSVPMRGMLVADGWKLARELSWHTMFTCQPPLLVEAIVHNYDASSAQPRRRTDVSHFVDPNGLKLGHYGSRWGIASAQSRESLQKWDKVALCLKGWKEAETAADVLQILGVMDVD